jgi:hypothetical protein
MTLEESERALILETLEQAGWIVGGPGGAAARLGLKRTTLLAKMKRFGISRPIPQERASLTGISQEDAEMGVELAGAHGIELEASKHERLEPQTVV